jgi:hypothetical protein
VSVTLSKDEFIRVDLCLGCLGEHLVESGQQLQATQQLQGFCCRALCIRHPVAAAMLTRHAVPCCAVGNATVVYRNVSHICMEKSNIENYTKGVYVPILGR